MNDTTKIHDADISKDDSVYASKANESFDEISGPQQSFGLLLREYRESSGYSVERAAIATRIAYPFIEALEESDLGKLPATVFGRGFIRNLCKVYDKDPLVILEAYDLALKQGHGSVGTMVSSSLTPRLSSRKLLKPRFSLSNKLKPFYKAFHLQGPRQVKLVISLVAVSSLVSFSIFYYQSRSVSSNISSKKIENVPSIATSAANQAASTGEMPPETSVQAKENLNDLSKSIGGASSKEVVKAGPLTAEVSTSTQLEIDHYDGKGFQLIHLEPGTHSIDFTGKVTLIVKDVTAIELSYLGKPVGDLSARGKSRQLTFGALDQ